MKKFVRVLMMVTASSLIMISQLTAQTILCVDRDFAGDTSSTYTDTWPMISEALDAAGYTYDYWLVEEYEDNGPDATYMSNYDVVIWFTGEVWSDGGTMTADDEFNLILYMTMGAGKLFLNAQDWLWDIYPTHGTFNPGEFAHDQLGLVEVVQDIYHIEPGDPSSIADSAQFYGSPGSLAEGLNFPVVDIFTTDTDDGLYGDSLAQHLGQNLLSIQTPYASPGPAAIQYETEYFRSVFTTIDIAAINDITARNIFMHRIVDWLMYGATGVSELKPQVDNLVIRPNPVSDFVDIGMTNKMQEVSLYNSQGQQVLLEETNQASLRMDLSKLVPGLYILKVKTENGIVTDKLLKQ